MPVCPHDLFTVSPYAALRRMTARTHSLIRTLWLWAALLSLLLATNGLAVQRPPELVAGRVISVADGDTLTLRDDAGRRHRVRLATIDAPEREQPFGSQSRQHLARLVLNRNAQLRILSRDSYDRVVVVVEIDGRDVNLMQIAAGMAWHYRAHQGQQSIQERHAYNQAEQRARRAGLGLWGQRQPIAPWDFRRQQRSPR